MTVFPDLHATGFSQGLISFGRGNSLLVVTVGKIVNRLHLFNDLMIASLFDNKIGL